MLTLTMEMQLKWTLAGVLGRYSLMTTMQKAKLDVTEDSTNEKQVKKIQ